MGGARFFPNWAPVQALPAGDMALVLPVPGARTTRCAVPVRNLRTWQWFRVVLVNRRIGLLAEQFRWAIGGDDARAAIRLTAPDCAIVESGLAGTWTGETLNNHPAACRRETGHRPDHPRERHVAMGHAA